MAEKRKETAERMLVGDWSGARMLAARAAGSIGTDAWAMLARADRWSSFGGTVSWDQNPFLVGGIEGFLPAPMVDNSDLVWGFSFGFDDLVPLSLQETEKPDMKAGEAVRKARSSMFDTRSRRAPATSRKAAAPMRGKPIVRGGGMDAPAPRAAEAYRSALEMITLADVARASDDVAGSGMTVGLPPQLARSMAESSGLLPALRMKGPSARAAARPQGRAPGVQTVVPVRARSGGVSVQSGSAPLYSRGTDAGSLPSFGASSESFSSGPSARFVPGRAPGSVAPRRAQAAGSSARGESVFGIPPAGVSNRPARRTSLTTIYDHAAMPGMTDAQPPADITLTRAPAAMGEVPEGYVALDRPESVFVDMARESSRGDARAEGRPAGVFHKTLASTGMGPAPKTGRAFSAASGGRPSLFAAMPQMDPTSAVVAAMGRELARSVGVPASRSTMDEGILSAGSPFAASVPVGMPVSMKPGAVAGAAEPMPGSSWPVPPASGGRVLPQRDAQSIAPFRTVTGGRSMGEVASQGAIPDGWPAGIPDTAAAVRPGSIGVGSLQSNDTTELETIRLVEAGDPASRADSDVSQPVRGKKGRAKTAQPVATVPVVTPVARNISPSPSVAAPNRDVAGGTTAVASRWPGSGENPVLSASAWPRGNASTGSMTSSFRYVPSEVAAPAVVGVFSSMGEALQRLAVPFGGSQGGGASLRSLERPAGGEGGFIEIEEAERTFLMTRAGEAGPREGTVSGPGGSMVSSRRVVNPERTIRAASSRGQEARTSGTPVRPVTAPVQTAVVVGRRAPAASAIASSPVRAETYGASPVPVSTAGQSGGVPIGSRMGRVARIAGVETSDVNVPAGERLTIADVGPAAASLDAGSGGAREAAYGLVQQGVMIALGLRGGPDAGSVGLPAVLPERSSSVSRPSSARPAAEALSVMTGSALPRFETASASRLANLRRGTPIGSRYAAEEDRRSEGPQELRIEGDFGTTFVSQLMAGKPDVREGTDVGARAARTGSAASPSGNAASSPWKSRTGSSDDDRSAVRDVVGEISRTTTSSRSMDVGGLEGLFLVQKTLAKALRILSDESAAAANPTVRFLRDSAAAMDKVRAAAGSSSSAGGDVSDAAELTLVEMAGRESDTVKPGRAQAAPLPGIPGSRDNGRSGSDGLDFVTSAFSGSSDSGASGQLGSLFGGGSGGDAGGPMRGGMPLVSPVISVVAQQAMLSEDKPGTQVASNEPVSSGDSEPQNGPAVDLDGLANEMADRIARRMRRDKERRGFYG